MRRKGQLPVANKRVEIVTRMGHNVVQRGGISLKTQTISNRFPIYAIMLFVSILALYIRYLGRNVLSADFENCLSSWYDEIVGAGPGIDALLSYTGDYAIPYAFLIWLLSKLPLPFLYSVKMVNVVFDFGLAVMVGKIVKFFKPQNNTSFFLGYCVTLLLPNVFLNSSFWGQCDAIYTFFLLAAFLCYLYKKYPAMMLMLGLAFSFKLQSIFLLPFILIAYWLQREFSILQFFIIPTTMLAMNIPSIVAGYSPMITFTQYVRQANGYPWLYYFYPNLYFFFQARPYYLFSTGAVFLAVAALLIFVVLLVKRNVELKRDNLLPILLWTAYTCVFFLPSMHERYGYFAELAAVILALVNFRKSWIALIMMLCTFPKYLYALNFAGNSLWIQFVTVVGNTFLYILYTCMLWRQLFQTERGECNVEG